jgi:DNA sulfur modification protein DndE
MKPETKDRLRRMTFNPTKHAEKLENSLRPKLGFSHKYETARLAIGRSLAEPTNPRWERVTSEERGRGIEGSTLFGDDFETWCCAICLQAGSPDASAEFFAEVLEAHWKRGAQLLSDELEAANGNAYRLIRRLSDLLPERPESRSFARRNAPRALDLTIGRVSRTIPSGDPVSFSITGRGVAPHIALMGRNGSGKTMTGMQIAAQITSQGQIPFLMIDPKGEFVDSNGGTLLPPEFDVAVCGIEVGRQPIPLDVLCPTTQDDLNIHLAASQFRDIICLCCDRTGDAQKESLRKIAFEAIASGKYRGLDRIRDLYHEKLESDGKKIDSVHSRLSEITQLKVFTPEQSPAEFFSKSWVISLKELRTEELKKLVTLLLIDAVSQYLLAQPDSVVSEGERELRHLLVIDEARRILSNRRFTSLGNLVRQGRSKGSVVMLLSQDPGDFEGPDEDFMSQLGTIIAFACSKTDRGIKALEGPFGRRLRGSDFSDTALTTGVALVKTPNLSHMKVQAWTPDVSQVAETEE